MFLCEGGLVLPIAIYTHRFSYSFCFGLLDESKVYTPYSLCLGRADARLLLMAELVETNPTKRRSSTIFQMFRRIHLMFKMSLQLFRCFNQALKCIGCDTKIFSGKRLKISSNLIISEN